MSRREPRADQTMAYCGCISTPIHGLIDACQGHSPWTMHDLDLDYFVRMRLTPHNISCEFELFNRSAIEARGQEGEENFDNVTPFVLGRVKWDECSDWTFSPAAHFCEREQVAHVGIIMERVYDLAFAMVTLGSREPL